MRNFDSYDLSQSMPFYMHVFVMRLQDQYIFCYRVIHYVLECLQEDKNISG